MSSWHDVHVRHPACRLYVIHRCRNLKQLDFRKVKQKEREEAVSVFGSGQQAANGVQEKPATFEPDEELAQAEAATAAAQQQARAFSARLDCMKRCRDMN